MELEARLRALAAFARRLSFSGAAEQLRISQPAVSRHIADIERRLGVRLVERHARGGALTPAGEFVTNHVLRAEAILAQAARGVTEFREPSAGSLAVAASGVPGTYLLPDVVAAFHQAHPGVRVTVQLGTSARAVELLRAHQAELGVVGGFVAAPEIEVEPLVDDDIVVVGCRGLGARRLSREELESLTWIFREEGSASREAVEAAWTDLGIAPAHRLELPAWEAIKVAVSRGYGIAACSRLAIESELRFGMLDLVRIPRWNVRRTISIIRVRDAAMTPSARQFVSMLHALWSRTSRYDRSARRARRPKTKAGR
jgi:DNA-binding transcriptional LysR family regulator